MCGISIGEQAIEQVRVKNVDKATKRRIAIKTINRVKQRRLTQRVKVIISERMKRLKI